MTKYSRKRFYYRSIRGKKRKEMLNFLVKAKTRVKHVQEALIDANAQYKILDHLENVDYLVEVKRKINQKSKDLSLKPSHPEEVSIADLTIRVLNIILRNVQEENYDSDDIKRAFAEVCSYTCNLYELLDRVAESQGTRTQNTGNSYTIENVIQNVISSLIPSETSFLELLDRLKRSKFRQLYPTLIKSSSLVDRFNINKEWGVLSTGVVSLFRYSCSLLNFDKNIYRLKYKDGTYFQTPIISMNLLYSPYIGNLQRTTVEYFEIIAERLGFLRYPFDDPEKLIFNPELAEKFEKIGWTSLKRENNVIKCKYKFSDDFFELLYFANVLLNKNRASNYLIMWMSTVLSHIILNGIIKQYISPGNPLQAFIYDNRYYLYVVYYLSGIVAHFFGGPPWSRKLPIGQRGVPHAHKGWLELQEGEIADILLNKETFREISKFSAPRQCTHARKILRGVWNYAL